MAEYLKILLKKSNKEKYILWFKVILLKFFLYLEYNLD